MKLAFLGLGTMGEPMSGRLLAAGHELAVYNRSPERAAALGARGARVATDPAAAAAGAEVVIVMVSDTPDVASVVFGPGGAAEGLGEGAILLDMSTISPSATRDFAERLAALGARWVDAPVSGGSEGAQKGTLSIMVGGEAADLARLQPVFEVLGSTVTHLGPVGAGQLAKAINQVIIAGTYAAVAEGLVLGLKAGIDVEAALKALAGGAAGSWGLVNRGPNVVRNEYPLGFRLTLHRKDLGIALETARELGVPLPLAALVEQWETGLIARGHGDEDVSSIARVAREQAGLDD